MPRTLRAWVMGRYAIEIDQRIVDVSELKGRRQATDLLALLLLRATHRASTDEVIEELWADREPATAQQTLYRSASQLRTLFREAARAAEPLVQISGGYVGIHPAWQVETDLAAFDVALQLAKRSLTEESCATALALYGGEVLADDRYASWAAPRRQEVERERAWLLTQRSRFALRHDDFETLLTSAQAVAKVEPWNEEAHRHIMQAFAGLNRRAEALRHYQRLASHMERMFGAHPAAATRILYEHLAEELTAESATDARPTAPEQPIARPALPVKPQQASPFVGRERELLLLTDLLGQFPSTGSAAFIGGESGVGKTRLARELAEAAREKGLAVFIAGCSLQSDNAPFGPFAEVIAAYVRTVQREEQGIRTAEMLTPEQILDCCEPLLLLVPEFADRAQSNEKLYPDSEQRILGHAFVTWLGRRADKRGVVLVLDDLQWADAQTLAVMRFILNRLSDTPVLLLGIYRDDVPASGRLTQLMTDAVRKGQAHRIVLNRLSRAEVVELIQGALNAPPSSELASSIYSVTNGNPLFVEGIVENLLHDDGVQIANGEVQAPRNIIVPQELADIIRQRVDMLSPMTKRVLECAATLGTHSDHFVLERMISPDADGLLDAIDEARQVRILVDDGEGYTFQHGVVRDVVYRRLSTGRRMWLHRRAAETLEALPNRLHEDFDHRLAFHWGQAGDAPVKAAEYYTHAAEHARRLGALDEALANFSAAVAQVRRAEEHSPVHADALVGIAKTQAMAGKSTESRATYEQALQVAYNRPQTAYIYRLLGDVDARSGQYAAALDWYRRGLDTIGPEPSGERLRLLLQAAQAEIALGHVDEAEAMHAESERLLPTHGRPFDAANRAYSVGHLANLLGRTTAAAQYFRDSLATARACLDLGAQSRAHHAIGYLELHEGDIGQAQKSFEDAVKAAKRAGYPAEQATALISLHYCYTLLGDSQKALAISEKALAIARHADLYGLVTECTLGQALSLFLLGRGREAEAELELVARSTSASDDLTITLRLALGVARLYLIRGEYARALETLRSARARCTVLANTPEYVQSTGLLGATLLASDDAAGAELLQRAHRDAEERRFVFGQCFIYAFEFNMLRRRGKTAEALSVYSALEAEATRYRMPALIHLADEVVSVDRQPLPA